MISKQSQATANKENDAHLENVVEEIEDVEVLKSELMLLKSMVVNSENLAEIKLKICQTAKYRAEMLKNIKVDLRTEFPYFFAHGELVKHFNFNWCEIAISIKYFLPL